MSQGEKGGRDGANRMGGVASKCVVEFVCAKSARRRRMRRALVGVVVAALGCSFSGALIARADNRPTPKGPDEDGTKPALVKIAGEGMMDSHAFQYLTELDRKSTRLNS